MKRRLKAFFLCWLLFYITIVAFTVPSLAQVTPDGTTPTSVSTASSGLITVDIAPADTASISHNRYTNFSVPNTGVNLDNSIVSANTIINEVTSTNLTTIEGPLTVIGAQADVIVANPNGITVNGGRFQNTRNVALTTGAVGRDASNRVTSTVSTGEITIGASGLSGTMEELALISKTLKVNGAVAHDVLDGKSHINLITGNSTVNFDPARGGGGLLPWGLVTNPGSGSSGAVVVDIANTGSLTSGRISMTVTDTGAGVRFAGDQLASVGGFRLTSSGKLELSASKIQAKESVNISTASAVLTSDAANLSEITSENSGIVIETSNGDIDLGQAKLSGKTIASDNLNSEGGITLIADGQILTSQNHGRRAMFVSSDSNIVARANNLIRFEGLDIDANKDFRVLSSASAEFIETQGIIGADFRVLANTAVAFDASAFAAASDIRIDGSALRFGALDETQARTELVATNGGLIARSTSGDILNFGSLLQGKTPTSGDPDSRGGASIYAAGRLRNKSLSVARLGVIFGQESDLYIETGGDVLNETGRLFSNAALTIKAGGDLRNATDFTTETAPYQVYHIRGGRFAGSLFLRRKSTTHITANYGDLLIAGEQSRILGIGNVSLEANNVYNSGADITGAAVSITALNTFSNEARQTGSLNFYQRCRWFCKTSASSSLGFVDGSVSASGLLDLTAGTKITNIAGRFTGATGIQITAPLTEFLPTFEATLVERPSGLTGFFRGRRGWLTTRYRYGTLSSFVGPITINGDISFGGQRYNPLAR